MDAQATSKQRKADHFRAGVLCILGCCLTITLGGLSLLWGTQVLYVASYYHHWDDRASISTMYFVFPIASGFFGGGSILTIWMYQKYGARKVIAGFTLMTCVCLFVTSYISNYVLFIIIYAPLQGLGCSGIVFPSMFPAWYYFPSHKGTVSGLIMVAYGAGCSLQGLAFTFLMNPGNESPTIDVYVQSTKEKLFDYSVARNYPMTFRIFAAIFLVVGLLGALLITEPKLSPTERKSLSNGGSVVSHRDIETTPECPGLKVALKTWAFWCLLITSATGYSFGYYMIVQFKTYATPYIHDDHLLSIIGAIGQVGNVMGRLILSILVDYVDSRLLLFLMMLTNSIMSATVRYTVTNAVWYTLWICITLFIFGFTLSPTAVICGKIFGPKCGGRVFSFVMLGYLTSNLSTIAINSGIQENYGFDTAFTFMALLALCASIVALTIKMKYNWEEQYQSISEGK